ncbi:dihydroorotase [Microthyrium microscopicum]|uniref:dihydroorotase n=1 Tax=Microthyrium microscopicum TaxID=703497 RepID=A0A6A6UBT3_9PEZI|nr:dihydroorotase [Microthyrium microscopicum]
MILESLSKLELPATADFHVHLRQDELCDAVVPTIRKGGVNVVYVMPNLIPPITKVKQCLDYKAKLEALEPKVTFLMSLYLHEDITPETIKEAKESGITGVKSYPAGVTTNSSSGVVDYEQFYRVFEEMQNQDLVLNLHGECPKQLGITVLNAEEKFLPTLLSIHAKFPKLRIILEHCTSAPAIEAVKQCGPTVVATITAHHLFLTIDDVVGDAHAFCKPVAKTDTDRTAILQAAVSNNPKFFLGTDSAPHPRAAKSSNLKKAAAGVFTQPYATHTVLDALERACKEGTLKEEQVTMEVLEGFLGKHGRKFYGVEESKEKIVLKRKGEKVGDLVEGSVDVVPFRLGEETWSLTWKT